jgi:hypothetical protein
LTLRAASVLLFLTEFAVFGLIPMTQFLPKPSVAAVVVVILALDALAIVLRFASEGPPSDSNWVAGLALSQAVLIGAWAGLGNAPMVARLPAATLATGLLIRLIGLAMHVPEPANPVVTIEVGGLVAFVAGLFAVGRLVGIRVITLEAINAESDPENWSRHWQFSLSQLLQMVAGWSLVLAILRWVFPPLISLPQFQANRLPIELPMIAGFFGGPMFVGVWAMLRIGKLAFRVALFAGILILLTFLFAPAFGAPRGELMLSVFLVYAAIIFVALLVCRLSGFRVVRRKLRLPNSGD